MFSLSSKVWSPPADVYETPDGIVVKIEIAGVSIDDLDILAKGSTLTVSGSRVDAEQSRQTAVHHVEIRHGNFERTFELPGVIDSENIQADYELGFLIIRIPKRNDPPKQIKIKTE